MTNPQLAHEELIGLYNEIDHFLRQQYKQDKYADHSFLIQELASSNPTIARYQQILRAVAQIRNSIIHNPVPRIAQPIVNPHPNLVASYRTIRDALLNPATSLSIAVPAPKIYTSTLEANLFEVMQAMHKNTFTHVPIITENKMIGVFSENVLLSYLVDAGEAVITNDMKMGDLKKYLPLSAQRGESFEFLSRKSSLGEVYKIFNEAIKIKKRIGMVFITEHGKTDEKLLGIITAWDLASPEPDLEYL